jgi:hypothetical protein
MIEDDQMTWAGAFTTCTTDLEISSLGPGVALILSTTESLTFPRTRRWPRFERLPERKRSLEAQLEEIETFKSRI